MAPAHGNICNKSFDSFEFGCKRFFLKRRQQCHEHCNFQTAACAAVAVVCFFFCSRALLFWGVSGSDAHQIGIFFLVSTTVERLSRWWSLNLGNIAINNELPNISSGSVVQFSFNIFFSNFTAVTWMTHFQRERERVEKFSSKLQFF